jgi:hypothetical protein
MVCLSLLLVKKKAIATGIPMESQVASASGTFAAYR